MSFPKKKTYNDFGGDLTDKNPSENYHTPGATDLPAEDSNIQRASLAGMTQTGALVYMKLDPANGAGLLEYETSWDKDKTTMMTWQIIDVGQYRIILPPVVRDFQGNLTPLNIRMIQTNPDANASTEAFFVSANRISPNVFDVYMWSISGGQYSDNATPIDIIIF